MIFSKETQCETELKISITFCVKRLTRFLPVLTSTWYLFCFKPINRIWKDLVTNAFKSIAERSNVADKQAGRQTNRLPHRPTKFPALNVEKRSASLRLTKVVSPKITRVCHLCLTTFLTCSAARQHDKRDRQFVRNTPGSCPTWI